MELTDNTQIQKEGTLALTYGCQQIIIYNASETCMDLWLEEEGVPKCLAILPHHVCVYTNSIHEQNTT